MIHAAHSPLSRYRVAHSKDQDEFKSLVAGVFRDHELSVQRSSGYFAAELDHCPLGDISVNYIAYGAEVHVDPGCLNDFYLIHVPLKGTSVVEVSGELVHTNPEQAVICSPSHRVRFQWSDECGVLAIRIERSAVERQMTALAGAPVLRSPSFDPRLPFDQDSSWRNLSNFLCSELGRERHMFMPPGARAALGQMLITALLTQHDHDLRHLLDRPGASIAPRHVRKAEEFMAARLGQPLTMVDIVEAVGVSERTLFEGFRRFRNTSPMAWLKARRMEKAHEALLQGAPNASVTGIAMEWGFYHLGNFSAAYRDAYGERPSETLKKAQERQ